MRDIEFLTSKSLEEEQENFYFKHPMVEAKCMRSSYKYISIGNAYERFLSTPIQHMQANAHKKTYALANTHVSFSKKILKILTIKKANDETYSYILSVTDANENIIIDSS